jgi:hypothetical protein
LEDFDDDDDDDDHDDADVNISRAWKVMERI